MSRRRKQQSRRPGGGAPWRRPPAGSPIVGDEPVAPASPRDPAAAREEADRLLGVAAGGRRDARDAARAALAALPVDAVVAAASPRLLGLIGGVWARGWQPVEVTWHVRRRAGAGAADLAVALVAADAARIARRDLHPAWAAQLDELGVAPPEQAGSVATRWLAGAEGPDPVATVTAVADLVAVLGRMPPLPVLVPVPGRPDIALDGVASGIDAEAGIDPQVLARVRALLAKAESTTFEAEAQAFTAKAHELMDRHSLEHAVVASRSGARDRPVARRLLLDDPYADAKAYLVQVIAASSGCRAVSLRELQMSTVIGFEEDLAAVEVLFTSLLVQAQTALQELARAATAGSRERSRGFRSSFLRGFAHRIGERLARAHEATVAAVDREESGALVPVLARRESDVEAQVDELFPRLVRSRATAPSDALGWYAGSDAAERAALPWERLGSSSGG